MQMRKQPFSHYPRPTAIMQPVPHPRRKDVYLKFTLILTLVNSK